MSRRQRGLVDVGEHAFDCGAQLGKILRHGIPHDAGVHTVVVVLDADTHADDVGPRGHGISGGQSGWQTFGGFGDNDEGHLEGLAQGPVALDVGGRASVNDGTRVVDGFDDVQQAVAGTARHSTRMAERSMSALRTG